MSDISVQRLSDVVGTQPKQAQSAPSTTSRLPQTAAQRLSTADLADGPSDVIVTSPEASAALGALNSQLSAANAESQKEFDAKQLKAAIQQLHILQLLGIGLGPEKLAKQTTDLAKQIAGLAKDYAENSGSSQPGAITAAPSVTSSATSEADTATAQANGTAAIQATGHDAVASSAQTATDQAAQSARAAADKTAQSAGNDKNNAQSAPGATDASAASTPTGGAVGTSAGSGANQGAAEDPDKAAAESPGTFFAEVTAAFKVLKKLETRALSELNLSPDKEKKDKAKKLGGEFNDAALSAAQSATASGANGAELAAQTIDLSKVTINISV